MHPHHHRSFPFSSCAGRRARRRLQQQRSSLFESYNGTVDAGTDVFVATAGYAALESALPSALRVVSEGYISTRSDSRYLCLFYFFLALHNTPELVLYGTIYVSGDTEIFASTNTFNVVFLYV